MNLFVLAVGVIQALVGVFLLVKWGRGGRHAPRIVLVHVVLNLTAIAAWVVFLVTGVLWIAWTSFAVLTVGNGFGDALMLARARRVHGASDRFGRGYADALRAVFTGRMPAHVAFHALFSGVVYFGMLIACILASVG